LKHCKSIPTRYQNLIATTESCKNRNETLPDCDPTLFQMSVNFDNYYWEDDNITDICDGNCTIEARDWDLDVSLACGDGEKLVDSCFFIFKCLKPYIVLKYEL
jgi:hypothetical protein